MKKIAQHSIIVIGLIAGLFLLIPIWASADIMTFDLENGNTAISGYSGPYAEVQISTPSLNSNTATITFTSLTNSGNIYLLGGRDSVDVNVNATTWTLGTIAGSNDGTGFTPGPYSNGGSANVDGWGIFNQTITSFDGFGHSSDTITFILTNTSGTWADASDVLIENADGFLAAAHIFVTSDPANKANGALATGFASGDGGGGGGGGGSIPEPGTIVLLGCGLVGLGLYGRFRIRK